MANVKISQLPAAVSLIPNVDVAPIVHTGTTYKATPNQIVQAVLPSPGPIGSVTPNTAVFTTLSVAGATTLATTLTGLLKASSGVVSTAIAGTDYLGPTTGSAIQKANGSGGLTNAVSGTDYAPATSGTSILYGNGSGGFSNVTVGSGLQFSGGTLVSTSGGGSVTTVSVVSANGFAGTVANASSTPAITLSTSVTGLLKGNGTAISAATAGTDYQAAITATGILKGTGGGSVSAAVSGTDYAPATSGSSILYGNGAGGFSNVTIGSNLTFAGGTLSAAGSTGVTSVTATTPLASSGGTTPNLTIQQASGSQSGYLSSTDWTTFNSKGSGTVTSVSGTGTVNGLTLTGTVTTSGSLTLGGTLDLSAPPAIGGTTPAAITGTTITANTKFVSSYFDASGSGGGALRTSAGSACLQWGAGGGVNLTLDGAFNMNPANANISIAPTGTGTLTVNPATAGTISNMNVGACTVDGTNSVGYLNIPQNSQTTNYTLVAADSGKHIYNPSGSSITFTIPANGSVAYAIGTAITFVNMASTSTTIAITTDTMYLGGTGSTGSRTLAQYGVATAIKIASTTWIISGTGLT